MASISCWVFASAYAATGESIILLFMNSTSLQLASSTTGEGLGLKRQLAILEVSTTLVGLVEEVWRRCVSGVLRGVLRRCWWVGGLVAPW